jgi:hypothetical protein
MSEPMPRRRWELSAPESQMLLWGPETGDAWVLKQAILDLVVRRDLRLVTVPDRRLLVFAKRTDVLVRARPIEAPAPRALSAVTAAFPTTRTYGDGTTGAPVDKVARAVFGRYQKDGGFGNAIVLPALEQRGLFRGTQTSRSIVYAKTTWALTPEGLAALEELRTIMATGRALLPGWVDRDPNLARRFVELAGPALLLHSGLTPMLQHLRRWAADQPDGQPDPAIRGGDPYSLAALTGAFGPGPADGLDAAFAAISLGVDRAWKAFQRASAGSGE